MARIRDSLQTSLALGRKQGFIASLIIVWGTLVLAVLPPTRHLGLFTALQNWAYDTALQQRLPLDPRDVVIVGIDERSTMPSHLGRFPWPREVYARLLDRLSQARAVGFDVIFHEPERDGQGDLLFAEALARHGRCVLVYHLAHDVEVSQRAHRPPPALPLQEPPPLPWLVRQLQLQAPLEVLADAAAGMGFADLRADPDGLYRRAPVLIADEQGHYYPHFAVEVARVALGKSPAELSQALGGDSLRLGVEIPLDRQGQTLINYCGPSGTVPVVPFCDVYEGRREPDYFKGKVVLVGATAAGLHDVRPAPFARRQHFYLGVETNASLVRMFLYGPALRDASGSLAWLIGAGLLASLAMYLTWNMKETLAGVLVGVTILVFDAVVFFAAFYGRGVVLPFGPAILATGLGVSWSAWRRIGLERNVIRSQFSVYVSPRVLDSLMRNPEVLYAGERRELTLLFADIRSSTALAERLPPEVWLAQLNEYLTAMSEVILAHEGYLDKFMGDGIMAIWNTFGNQPHHRDLALAASVAMLQRLEALNDEWERRADRSPLRIGIGVH
ncbi:MAG: adenylate/guanylate cyclase domain-containing protein, partial [Armatimonadetes bacterium]|nr:adenylate/guanylate cyclase domain-containing protein [Armatimonadota bacterium]